MSEDSKARLEAMLSASANKFAQAKANDDAQLAEAKERMRVDGENQKKWVGTIIPEIEKAVWQVNASLREHGRQVIDFKREGDAIPAVHLSSPIERGKYRAVKAIVSRSGSQIKSAVSVRGREHEQALPARDVEGFDAIALVTDFVDVIVTTEDEA